MKRAVVVVLVCAIALVVVVPGSPGRRLAHDLRGVECYRRPAAGATVAIGDSITRQNSDPAWGFQGDASWFSLAVCGGGTRYGYNAGVANETTGQMAQRFGGVLGRKPASVVILGGTNDVLGQVDPATTAANLRQMVRRAKAAGVTVYVGTIPPVDGPPSPAVTQLNASIVALAADEAVPVIDFHRVLADSNLYRSGLTTDGVHPSRAGAKAMAAAWASARP